jgi:hypothetical protein
MRYPRDIGREVRSWVWAFPPLVVSFHFLDCLQYLMTEFLNPNSNAVWRNRFGLMDQAVS